MKRFALLPALFALLLAAVLTGAAFAQQAPPGPTSPQAGDMIPDANTIAAFAARSATAGNTSQPGNMLPDTIAAFAARSATAANSRQAGDMIPDANTIAAFAAQSTPLESASNAETQWQILQHQAYGLAQGSQTAQSDLTTAQSATWASASQAEAQWQIAQRQAYGLAQGSQTAQLAPSHFDDSIEAPQVAAAMRAMAAIHVPSMEAIRLALASAKSSRGREVTGSEVAGSHAGYAGTDRSVGAIAPQLSIEAAQVAAAMQATPAQSAQTAQTVGGPVVLPTEATSQVAILAEAGSQMAILQANRPAQGSQNRSVGAHRTTPPWAL